MPLHAQRQSLQATQHKKAIERAGNCADRILKERDLVGEFLVFADHDNTADQIRMPIEIFGSGVHDDVEASFDRTLNPRSRKCVIANGNNFALARDLCDRFQINQLQQRVARRFDPNHARIWFDGTLEIFAVGQIDISKIKIGRTAAHSVEQAERASVKIVACDNMRAAFEQLQRGGDCGQAGCKCEPARAAFQIGNASFVGKPRWINRARIIVAFVLSRAFLDIRRCRINWSHHCAGRWIRLLPGMYRARGEALLLFHLDSI